MDATTTAALVSTFTGQVSDTIVAALPAILILIAGVLVLTMLIRWTRRHVR